MFEKLERKLLVHIAKIARTDKTPYLAEDVFSMLLCYRLEKQGYVVIEPLGDWLDNISLENRFSIPIKIGVTLTDAGIHYITEQANHVT